MEDKKLIEAFLEKPSTYVIDVLDNSMLPNGIKDKKELKFTIKRPTLKVLGQLALPLSGVPKEIREKEVLQVEEVAPYVRNIAEVVAIMAHGASSKPMPNWYVDFFLANLTDRELFLIFKEASLKLENSFFLTFTHISAQTNPMMINDSTPMN